MQHDYCDEINMFKLIALYFINFLKSYFHDLLNKHDRIESVLSVKVDMW